MPIVDEQQTALINKVEHYITKASAPAPSHEEEGKDDISNDALFAYVFFILLSAMSIRQNTVTYFAKELQANADVQEKENAKDADIQIIQIPTGNPGQATINRIQNENKQLNKIREDIQNKLITLRQAAQVQMTETNTQVNMVQQNATEDSAWLRTLENIFEVIVQITARTR
jgi:hypothetical protein